MPQELQVLGCYQCQTFQVHQVKKSAKWVCKLCGAKQSIKKVYGRGTGADCRKHVQKLNSLRGQAEALGQCAQGQGHWNDEKRGAITEVRDQPEQAQQQTHQEEVEKPAYKPASRWQQYCEVSTVTEDEVGEETEDSWDAATFTTSPAEFLHVQRDAGRRRREQPYRRRKARSQQQAEFPGPQEIFINQNISSAQMVDRTGSILLESVVRHVQNLNNVHSSESKPELSSVQIQHLHGMFDSNVTNGSCWESSNSSVLTADHPLSEKVSDQNSECGFHGQVVSSPNMESGSSGQANSKITDVQRALPASRQRLAKPVKRQGGFSKWDQFVSQVKDTEDDQREYADREGSYTPPVDSRLTVPDTKSFSVGSKKEGPDAEGPEPPETVCIPETLKGAEHAWENDVSCRPGPHQILDRQRILVPFGHTERGKMFKHAEESSQCKHAEGGGQLFALTDDLDELINDF